MGLFSTRRLAPAGLVLLCTLSLACDPTDPTDPTPTPAGTAAATGTPAATPVATTTPTATPPPAGPSYQNPVYPRDFPDPFVLAVDGTYYGYATNVGQANVPTIRSTDLASWERAGDAMPLLPHWARIGFTWAPGVIDVEDGYALYFTARHRESGRQCIGVAIGDAPEGRFVAHGDEPMICQLDLGGSIDPYPFRDSDGSLYLYWKNDGNCCALDVWLWGQRLSADGLTLEGEPVQLLERDQHWERPLIENPAMVFEEGTYYLFYSGNRWDSADYAVGYGVCETVLGPCEKPLNEPLFTYGNGITGPGGQAFFYDADRHLWMAYHAWTGIRVGYPAGERSFRLEQVRFEDGRPVIEGPTVEPQPLP